jgi:hypothetical protein
MGIHGRQGALAVSNSKGSKDNGNKVDKESEGVEDNKGKGNEGDDGNFPK